MDLLALLYKPDHPKVKKFLEKRGQKENQDGDKITVLKLGDGSGVKVDYYHWECESEIKYGEKHSIADIDHYKIITLQNDLPVQSPLYHLSKHKKNRIFTI